MPERMNDGKFSGLWQRAANGAADRHDAYDLAYEAARARTEETQQQDRIHALEVQQAELLRQVKEKDAEIQALKVDCMRAQSAISRWRACAAAALDCVTGGRYAAACEVLARGLAGKP